VEATELFVRDLMTRDVVTLRPTDKLSTAEDVMHLGRMRHMPVLDDDGRLIGIVSQRDLFHNALVRLMGYKVADAQELRDAHTVAEAMTSNVVTVPPDTPLHEAARLMAERKIGSLVVIDDGKLMGILTEGDFVALVARMK
jgi:CBS domain-containing protein